MLLNQQQMGYFGDPGAIGFAPPMYDPNMIPMMNPYVMGFDPNMIMNPQFMMGMPQGFDTSMMNPQIYQQQQGSNTNGNTNN